MCHCRNKDSPTGRHHFIAIGFLDACLDLILRVLKLLGMNAIVVAIYNPRFALATDTDVLATRSAWRHEIPTQWMVSHVSMPMYTITICTILLSIDW